MSEFSPTFDKVMFPNGVNGDFYNLNGLNDEDMLNTFISRFENGENRDIAKVAPQLIDLFSNFGLNTGNTVADIGCGTGLLLELLSRAVGEEGKVIATEISKVFYNHLLQKKTQKNLNNVTIVFNDVPSNPNLETFNQSVDLILVIDVYHHFEYPITIMRYLKSCLKPTGRLIVLDFIRDETIHKSHPPGWIISHVRAGQDVFQKEIESAGFVLVENIQPDFVRSQAISQHSDDKSRISNYSISGLDENYIMVFRPTNDLENNIVGAGWGMK